MEQTKNEPKNENKAAPGNDKPKGNFSLNDNKRTLDLRNG